MTRLLLLTTTTLLLLTLLLALPSAHAQSPEPLTIALYVPDLTFDDAVAKANFIQSIARQLQAATGIPIQGVSFARDADLKARKDLDLAIVSGAWYASSGFGKPIAYATPDADLAILTRPGEATALHQLRGKTLILPRTGNLLEDLITATALDHELRARDFFKITWTGDVPSALTAVKLGQADATLAFAPYAGPAGLQVLYRAAPGPAPVVVLLNDTLPPDQVQSLTAALRSLTLPATPGGLLKGFGGAGAGLRGFRGAASARPRVHAPVMAEDRNVRLRFDVLQSAAPPPWQPAPPQDLVPTPDLPPEAAP